MFVKFTHFRLFVFFLYLFPCLKGNLSLVIQMIILDKTLTTINTHTISVGRFILYWYMTYDSHIILKIRTHHAFRIYLIFNVYASIVDGIIRNISMQTLRKTREIEIPIHPETWDLHKFHANGGNAFYFTSTIKLSRFYMNQTLSRKRSSFFFNLKLISFKTFIRFENLVHGLCESQFLNLWIM